MSTIADIIGFSSVPEAERQVIINALVQREDEVADYLRLTGQQFGLYPQIVAEVLAASGLGSPVSEEERVLIRQQFITLMDQLRRGEAPPPGGEAPPEG